MKSALRIFAIDWSGDRLNGRTKIWLAEVRQEELVRLVNGRSREEIAAGLITEAERDPRFMVGLDFAFSFPQWYCEELGAKTAVDVWTHATNYGEDWLARCPNPFFGHPGKKCCVKGKGFRTTEAKCAGVNGIRPKSVFQIGGAGAVGTGSVRGMPVLKTLHEAGFSIWPFDPPGWPRVVEIYPRALTGSVNKSSSDACRRYLRTNYPGLSKRFMTIASSCEDAFDAAVSALVMSRHADELVELSQARNRQHLLEGTIWYRVVD